MLETYDFIANTPKHVFTLIKLNAASFKHRKAKTLVFLIYGSKII